MTYYVTFAIDGRYTAEVDLPTNSTPQQIKEEAQLKYMDADFGELEDVDAEPVSITDPDDNFIWEK